MSLIAHYKLDGNANDALGKYNGTASNVTWVDGKLGKAGSFNGSTSYIETQLSTAAHNLLSVSFWIFNQNLGSFGLMGTVSDGRTFNLYRYPNMDDFHWSTGGASGVDYAVLLFDQWTHVVLVSDGSTIKRYYNGTLKGTSAGSIAKNTSLVHIGRNDSGYSAAYIDDIRFYDHALSEREVRDLSQGLVLHYTFDQFQGPTESLYASSLKEFTGSLVFPITPPVPPENGGTWSSITWRGDITIPAVSAGESVTWSGYYMPYSSDTSLTPISSDIMGIHAWSSRGGEGNALSCPEWNKWYKFTFTRTFDSSATSVRIEDRGYDYFNTNADPYTSSYWCNVQIEKKGYATPFVNGTRAGIVRDQSTQGNDAPLVLANTPKWVEGGMVGKGCYELNQTKYITLPKSTLGSLTNCTFSFWRKRTSAGSWIVGNSGTPTGSSYFMATSGGTGAFYHSGVGTPVIYRDGVLSTTPANDDLWHHYCLVGANLSTWVNLHINAYDMGTTWLFRGQIDDVRIYTTALTAEEIRELYQQRASLDSGGNLLC